MSFRPLYDVITRQDVLQIFRGLLMGSADIVPGVSGGTVALILGIYRRLVTAISRFDLLLVRLVTTGRFRAAARRVDLRFLGFLGAGIGIGVVGLAATIHWLLDHELERTLAAFFGMILASSLLVSRLVTKWDVSRYASLALGAAFAFWLVGLPFLQSPPETPLYLFACGMVAISAMILPGISGAFILLILGKYYDVTGALKNVAGGDLAQSDLLIVSAFGLGAMIGIISFSKLLRFLLQHFESTTMAVLCGFMLGSLRKVWPYKTDLTPDETEFKNKVFENHLPDLGGSAAWITLAFLMLGLILVIALERTSTRRGGMTT